ncbi:hypothetical protein [Mesorhizobium sp. M1A.T.Ca.IN.004.03.1.1]|uniref:hypothetical protein n=1 Tax=Mesorhizobium sp. M1A.T.Ca.IN.004.03.1.1 TaxID=2496795 RepID=UPI0013E32D43|nr:hypothetical protein [Mesorhizobium sp. M1A.T.Ca.IN.004.03.1.1]
MRWPLVVIALFVGLVLWDHFANDSAYTADIERSFASLQTAGGWRDPTIHFHNPLDQ